MDLLTIVFAVLWLGLLFVWIADALPDSLKAEKRRAIHRERNPAVLPYKPRVFLATKAELRFYEALIEAIEPGLRVFAKCRVADIINCDDAAWSDGYGPPISSRHFDFVIVGKSLRILAAIELDDKSHERPERRARDKFLETAMAAAGVPLMRWKVQWEPYDPEKIRRRIYATLREYEQERAAA